VPAKNAVLILSIEFIAAWTLSLLKTLFCQWVFERREGPRRIIHREHDLARAWPTNERSLNQTRIDFVIGTGVLGVQDCERCQPQLSSAQATDIIPFGYTPGCDQRWQSATRFPLKNSQLTLSVFLRRSMSVASRTASLAYVALRHLVTLAAKVVAHRGRDSDPDPPVTIYPLY